MDKEVATSTLHQKRSRHQPAKKSRSRHQSAVATSVALKGGRDIIKRSRQQKQGKEVATSVSCRDIHCKGSKVTTSSSCRDISYKGRKVATSFRGRDIRCTDQKVATSYSSRDIKYKELRSRHQEVVTTPNDRKAGRDIIKLSRHQL